MSARELGELHVHPTFCQQIAAEKEPPVVCIYPYLQSPKLYVTESAAATPWQALVDPSFQYTRYRLLIRKAAAC